MTVCKRNGEKVNKALKLIVAIAALGVFIACGDDSGSSAPEQDSDSIESADADWVVKAFDELPVCSDKRKGSTAFIKDEKVVYVCENGDWTLDDTEIAESTKKVSSSSQKAISSSNNGKVVSSSSFKYAQDSSAYVQPKIVAVKNKTISGVSQKGPFVTGSTVKLYELDGKTLAQTGKSFAGKITSDDGKFSISSVSLASQYALLEATGYFRNEVTGEKSKGTITLNALTDLSDRKNVNINLLTHLEYERVLHLIESGINFKSAKKQAETEILNAFGIKGEFANSEDLDIFGKDDGNAALLAFSVLMLGGFVDEDGLWKEYNEAALTERLTNFATDIAKDGSWDDEITKAAIAAMADSYSSNEEEDYDYYKEHSKYAEIRRYIEKWNLGTVPNFEKYVRNFWVVFYGLGKCDSNNEGEIVGRMEERHIYVYSYDYFGRHHYICKEGVWKRASSFQINTYQWSAGKDGEIRDANLSKMTKYVYDGKVKKWRIATEVEEILGGCTEAREKDFSKNIGNFFGTWYICKNREWEKTDSLTVDTQAWGKGEDGELRKGDSTIAIYKYDEALKKWFTSNQNDTTLKLNGCTTKRIHEVSKSSINDDFYVCDSVYYDKYGLIDSVMLNWRQATIADLGVCTENRENAGKVNGSWYICKNGKWKATDKVIIVDTQGWSNGKDGELRKGDSTNAFYKYDEAMKEWLTSTKNDTTLKLNGCTTNRDGEIHKVDGEWYICIKRDWNYTEINTVDTYGWLKGKDGELRKGDSSDAFYKYDEYQKSWVEATYNDTILELNGCTKNRNGEVSKSPFDESYYICKGYKNCDWTVAAEIEYDTYGENCATTEVGKRMDGVVTKTNKYYCTENGWIRITEEWSWDVPKEARLNPKIIYGILTDSRDKKVYKTVKIGNQVWMAENLNYADSANTRSLMKRSWCQFEDRNCAVVGRFYTWAAAIDSVALATDKKNPQNCGFGKTCTIPAKVQGICPNGWHLPSKAEWETLISTVGEESSAGKILKSQTGWDEGGNGTDYYGFSAVPAGDYNSSYKNVGLYAEFWSATEVLDAKFDCYYFGEDGCYAYNVTLFWGNKAVFGDDNYSSKKVGKSVRCLQD